MKRRKALNYIVLGTAAAVVFPHCSMDKFPNYNFISLNAKKWDFLQRLSHAVLPIPEDYKSEEINPSKFLLTMMDDCHSPEEIDRFNAGFDSFYKEYKNLLNENASIKPSVLLDLLEQKEETDEQYFLKKVHRFNVQYYTGLQDYMLNQLNFEFAPGRFIGCVNV